MDNVIPSSIVRERKKEEEKNDISCRRRLRRHRRRVVSLLSVCVCVSLFVLLLKKIFCSSGAIFQLTISRSHALFVQQQPNEDDEAIPNSLRSCALLLLLVRLAFSFFSSGRSIKCFLFRGTSRKRRKTFQRRFQQQQEEKKVP